MMPMSTVAHSALRRPPESLIHRLGGARADPRVTSPVTGVAAHHDVGVAALLEVRIEDRLAGRAPARLPLQRMETATACQDSPGNIHRNLCCS